MVRLCFTLLLVALVAPLPADSKEAKDFPPGWVPINILDEKPAWADFRKIDDKIHLYIPKDAKSVRGVFVCFVFHNQDPRELAELWEFALVTVPWPFEYRGCEQDREDCKRAARHGRELRRQDTHKNPDRDRGRRNFSELNQACLPTRSAGFRYSVGSAQSAPTHPIACLEWTIRDESRKLIAGRV